MVMRDKLTVIEAVKSSSVKSTFIDGLRVTDDATMEIAQVSCSCSANDKVQ